MIFDLPSALRAHRAILSIAWIALLCATTTKLLTACGDQSQPLSTPDASLASVVVHTNSPTPEPTTAETLTPVPTETQVPTLKPTNTATPRPTPTAAPTYTPAPTATQAPTATWTSVPTPDRYPQLRQPILLAQLQRRRQRLPRPAYLLQNPHPHPRPLTRRRQYQQ